MVSQELTVMFLFCKMSKALDEDPDPAVFLNADQEPASQNRVTLNFVQKYLMKSLYGLTTHQHNCHAFFLFFCVFSCWIRNQSSGAFHEE